MIEVNFSADELRTFLHLFGAIGWVGGQILMLGLLPVLRSVDGLAVRAAQAFNKIAWPFFGLAVVTGIWNLLEVELADASTGWNMVFGIKFLLVVVTGAAAFVHSRTSSAALRGATGGIGFLASVVVVFLGVLLGH